MRLVKAGRIVEDGFVRVVDDAPIPDRTPVIVTAARWRAETAALSRRAAPLGVVWPNNANVAELAPHLDRLAVVALVFPNFRDGRAYSQARLLRERLRFGGELRATGQVLRDQFLFLARSGFDAFEVSKDADAEAFAAVLARYTVFYQPAADERPWVARRRLMRASLAASG